MKKRGKAQAAMEYLLVVGLVFVIIVPMIYVFYSYSTEVSEEVTEAKVDRIANSLADSAEEVFYLGEPSKTTVKFDMPAGVFDVFVQNNRELIFWIGDIHKYKEMVIYSNVDLESLLIPHDFAPGKHAIRLEAKGSNVAMYSGDYDIAKRLSEIYNDFVRLLIVYASASKQDLITDGIVKEGNVEDVAYVYGSYDPGTGLSAKVIITNLQGNLYFLVGGDNLKAGINNVDSEADLIPKPSLGITINNFGEIWIYYLHTSNQLHYYDGTSLSWSPTKERANQVGNFPDFERKTVTADIIQEAADYKITLQWSMEPGNSITATIPVIDVAAILPRTDWLMGDPSNTDGLMEFQIISPGTYLPYTEGSWITGSLEIPHDENEKYLTDIQLKGHTIIATYLDLEGNEKTISFDSYIPLYIPGGRTFTIPAACPVIEAECLAAYRFVDKETYVEVYSP